MRTVKRTMTTIEQKYDETKKVALQNTPPELIEFLNDTISSSSVMTNESTVEITYTNQGATDHAE